MIPDQFDPCWRRVLTSTKDMAEASLATRIMVTRMRREVEKDPACLADRIAELRAFYTKNAFVSTDIARF